MTYYPLTPRQEQELRENARQLSQRNPYLTIEAVYFILSSSVFEGGRLTSSVSPQTLRQIADEEYKPR